MFRSFWCFVFLALFVLWRLIILAKGIHLMWMLICAAVNCFMTVTVAI